MTQTSLLPRIEAREQERLAALASYRVLDSQPEQAFDDFTVLASSVCATPIATISLVDEHRQWTKSVVGTYCGDVSREYSFCAHTIATQTTLIVQDATQDERFRDNPLVTADNGIRFYAGAPLITSEGFVLGTLSVIDLVPRSIEPEQVELLERLARQVMARLGFERASRRLAKAAGEIEKLQKLIPMCSFCKSVRNDDGFWSDVEEYLTTQSGMRITHGFCPSCTAKHFDPE